MADGKNTPGGLLDGLGENLMGQLEDKADPSKLLSESNLKKNRNAFWTCLIAAFLLMALSLGAAVYYNATKVSLLEEGIVSNVDLASLGLSQDSARSFAVSTLAYLQGTVSHWEPVIVIGDHIMPIPESFKAHMATVRGWFTSATSVLLAGAGIALVLLGRSLIGRKGGKKGSFSLSGYYIGAAVPLLLTGLIVLWALLGFEGLWNALHRFLIPDGIFNAAEPIMRLFPVKLFEGYLRPVGMTFGVLAAAVLALPLILAPLSKPLTALFGKRGSAASTSSASRRSSAPRKSTAKRSSARKKKTTGASR